jgi:hypothetical protein
LVLGLQIGRTFFTEKVISASYFLTHARADARWKHIDTHVAILGDESSLKDNACRIIGTKTIDKNIYSFEYPVIDYPKTRKAYTK